MWNLSVQRLSPLSSITDRRFTLYDSRKIIVLDENGPRRMDARAGNVATLQRYSVMTLEYFDVLRQKCKVVQFLLYHKGQVTRDTLFDYIEHKFITHDEMDSEWHDQLSLTLKQMNYVQICPKLCMFELSQDSGHLHHTFRMITENGPLLQRKYTLQLNPSHAWFREADKVKSAKQHFEEDLADAFCMSADAFFENDAITQIIFSGDSQSLGTAVQRCYDTSDLDSTLDATLNTIRNCERHSAAHAHIRTSRVARTGSVRTKIAQKLHIGIGSKRWLEKRLT